MSTQRKVLSKDARKYRKQVEELREELAVMQLKVDEVTELERQLADMTELKAVTEAQEKQLATANARLAHLEKSHDRDVKQRTNSTMKLKLANKKAARYAKLNKDLSQKLLDANREVEKLLKVSRENAVLTSDIKSHEFHRKAAQEQLEKEKQDAALERQYRLKELFTHEQTLEDLEKQKQETAKQVKVTEEVQKRLEESKKELLKTQVELDARDHVHNVRVSALHIQRDEIARLKDLVNQMKEDINIQRGEIAMWSTRYKRMRDGFRILQARLAKTLRESHTGSTASEKAKLVSPPESSLELLAREMKEAIEADSHIRAKADTYSSRVKQRELDYGEGVTRDSLRASMRQASELRGLPMPRSSTAGQLHGTQPRAVRPAPLGFRPKHAHGEVDCHRDDVPAHRRKLASAGDAGLGATDSYMGVGPAGLRGKPAEVTADGYVISGDGGARAAFGGASMTDAMDAVMGTVSSARANFYDTKWLQDDAMIAGIMASEAQEMKAEARHKKRAARAKLRVGKPRPAAAAMKESRSLGSLYVGKGLGLKKDVSYEGPAGSVRQVLAKILSANPEVERLRRLEQSKLPF